MKTEVKHTPFYKDKHNVHVHCTIVFMVTVHVTEKHFVQNIWVWALSKIMSISLFISVPSVQTFYTQLCQYFENGETLLKDLSCDMLLPWKSMGSECLCCLDYFIKLENVEKLVIVKNSSQKNLPAECCQHILTEAQSNSRGHTSNKRPTDRQQSLWCR